MNIARYGIAVTALVAALFVPQEVWAKKCLFVSSYHHGYAWSDGVERGVRQVLADECELKQFDMDTKRRKSEAEKQEAALKAKALIESWKPDIVITADDNAAKYLIQPFYKDAHIPFVFCGVNWTADEYGFPYSNVTGIVEVAPIRPMLSKAMSISGSSAMYIGADTLTEKKNLSRFEDEAAELGITLDHRLAATTADWLRAYQEAQNSDFVIIGSKSGINDWDHARVVDEVGRISRQLSVTNHGWMMPYSMFGMTKVPEEHGEWAATTALAILSGTSPRDIPIVANRKWDMWVNQAWLDVAEIQLPKRLLARAKRIQ